MLRNLHSRWLHLAVHFGSLTVVSFVSLTAGVRQTALVAVAAVQVVLMSYFWGHMLFTSTAAMAGVAGVSLLILGLSRPQVRNRTVLLTCGGLNLVASSLIRLQSAQLIVVLSALCLAITCWRNRCQFRIVKDGLIAGFTLVAILAGAAMNNAAVRSDEGLNRFLTDLYAYAPVVNSVQVHQLALGDGDPGLKEEKTTELSEMGADWNDIACLIWWYFIDEDVYSSKKLAQIHETLAGAALRPNVLRVVFATLGVLIHDNLFLLLIGVSLGLAFTGEAVPSRQIVVAFIWLGAFAVLAALLAVLKLPPRVYLSAGVTCWMMTLLTRFLWDGSSQTPTESGQLPLASEGQGTPQESKRQGARVWLTVMILCGAFVTRDHYQSAKLAAAEREAIDATVERLIDRDDPLQVLLVPFPFSRFDPLKSQHNLHEWKFIYLDGHQRSPRQKQIIEAHLGQPLPEAILANHPEIRFVVEPEARSLPHIRQFYRTHYLLDVRFPVEEKLTWGTVRRFEVQPIRVPQNKPGQAAAEPVELDSGSGIEF